MSIEERIEREQKCTDALISTLVEQNMQFCSLVAWIVNNGEGCEFFPLGLDGQPKPEFEKALELLRQ